MTAKEAEVLAFCNATTLRGRALHRALAAHRGIKPSTAEIAVLRLIGKGYLEPDGAPAKLVRTLFLVDCFLAAQPWTELQRDAVSGIRDKIRDAVCGVKCV